MLSAFLTLLAYGSNCAKLDGWMTKEESVWVYCHESCHRDLLNGWLR